MSLFLETRSAHQPARRAGTVSRMSLPLRVAPVLPSQAARSGLLPLAGLHGPAAHCPQFPGRAPCFQGSGSKPSAVVAARPRWTDCTWGRASRRRRIGKRADLPMADPGGPRRPNHKPRIGCISSRRCGLVFLVGPAHDDLQGIIRQIETSLIPLELALPPMRLLARRIEDTHFVAMDRLQGRYAGEEKRVVLLG